MGNTIHIGTIIKQKLEESKMSIAEFAEQIYCDRTTVYDLFKRSNIDIDRLLRISKVLNYNFIENIYLAKEPPLQAPPTTSPLPEKDEIVYIAIPIRRKELERLNLPEGYWVLRDDLKK